MCAGGSILDMLALGGGSADGGISDVFEIDVSDFNILTRLGCAASKDDDVLSEAGALDVFNGYVTNLDQ